MRNYLEYLHKEKLGMDIEETNLVMKTLSDSLIKEVRREVNTEYLKHLSILSKYFRSESLELLYDKMEEKMFSPGETII